MWPKSAPKKSLFVLAKSPVLDAGSGGIGDMVFDRNNHSDGVEAKKSKTLLPGHTSNLDFEDMAKLP